MHSFNWRQLVLLSWASYIFWSIKPANFDKHVEEFFASPNKSIWNHSLKKIKSQKPCFSSRYLPPSVALYHQVQHTRKGGLSPFMFHCMAKALSFLPFSLSTISVSTDESHSVVQVGLSMYHWPQLDKWALMTNSEDLPAQLKVSPLLWNPWMVDAVAQTVIYFLFCLWKMSRVICKEKLCRFIESNNVLEFKRANQKGLW
mgnify:CR=1 FL=1